MYLNTVFVRFLHIINQLEHFKDIPNTNDIFIFEKSIHFYFLKKCVDIFSNFQKCWKCMILNIEKMVSKRSKINVGLWEKIDKLWHAKKKKKNSQKKKFETPKSCFLQSPETSKKKLVKK